MLSLENILAQFGVFTALDADAAANYMPLCRSAMETILHSLRPSADVEANVIRLEDAAAAIAFYRYILLLSAENCHNLRVGEINISPSSDLGLQAATAIKDEFLLSVADLLEYSNLVFKQV